MREVQKTSISIPNNFSFNETLSFLDRGFDECLYNLSDKAVSKYIQLSDGKGVVKIYQKEKQLAIELCKTKITKNNLGEAKAFVADWFDMKRDIEPFYSLLHSHHLLSTLREKYYGSRIIGIPNLFEAICWAVIGQQINLTFAYKLKRSLVEKYGQRVVVNNQIYHSFPSPEKLVKAKRIDLIEMKFSKQKIDYLMNVSSAFMNKEMSKAILLNATTKSERVEKLTNIKGIGIWSANYVLMKSLRDMSCITYGDAGLNKALHTIFKTQKKPTKHEVNEAFKGFEGWESYLNFYFWKSLSSV